MKREIGVSLLKPEIAEIVLDWGPVNSYDMDFLSALSNALSTVEGSPNVRVVILRSAIPGWFSAGADVKWFHRMLEAQNFDAMEEFCLFGHHVMKRIMNSGIVFIAQIEGNALGGGLEIALNCDYRIAAGDPKMKLGLPECTLGLLPGMTGTYHIPRLVKPFFAQRMIFTGSVMIPSTAMHYGFVDLYDHHSDARSVTEYAEELLKMPIESLRAAKRALRFDPGRDTLLDGELAQLFLLFRTKEAQQRIAAFATRKSKPKKETEDPAPEDEVDDGAEDSVPVPAPEASKGEHLVPTT